MILKSVSANSSWHIDDLSFGSPISRTGWTPKSRAKKGLKEKSCVHQTPTLILSNSSNWSRYSRNGAIKIKCTSILKFLTWNVIFWSPISMFGPHLHFGFYGFAFPRWSNCTAPSRVPLFQSQFTVEQLFSAIFGFYHDLFYCARPSIRPVQRGTSAVLLIRSTQ